VQILGSGVYPTQFEPILRPVEILIYYGHSEAGS